MNPTLELDLIPIKPPLWAKSGHLQTLAGHFIPTDPLSDYGERHEVRLPDGDTLLIFINRGTKPVVVSQYHGLSGDMTADYMRRGHSVASELGFTQVFVNHRGAGVSAGLSRHPYHSGRGEDISAVIAYLRKLFPGQKQIAIGYSIGANMLLNLLTGRRGTQMPDAGITVNACLDLARAAELLKTGLNHIYDKRFVRLLTRQINDLHTRGLRHDRLRVPLHASLYDFDRIYTASAGGFKSREDYYETCSTKHHLASIRTPLYMLTAADDPFIDVQDYRSADFSPSTHLTIADHGGHLGFIHSEALPHGNRRWLDHYIRTTLSALERLWL